MLDLTFYNTFSRLIPQLIAFCVSCSHIKQVNPELSVYLQPGGRQPLVLFEGKIAELQVTMGVTSYSVYLRDEKRSRESG